MYFDGHERADTLAARDKFPETKQEMYRRAHFWFVNEMGQFVEHKPVLRTVNGTRERPVIFVYHDEASAKTNDEQRIYWGTDVSQALRKKSDGANVMVSDFIDSLHGFVSLSDSEWKDAHDRVAKMPDGPLKQALRAKLPEQQAARVIFNSGVHGDAVEERHSDHGLPGSNWANDKGYWDNRSFTRQVKIAPAHLRDQVPDV
jgi:hypothetical protein